MKYRTLLFITLIASISFLSLDFSDRTMDSIARIALLSDTNRHEKEEASFIILKNARQTPRDILDALTRLDSAQVPYIRSFFDQYIKKIEKIQLPDTLKIRNKSK